jgi:hypothetical protein
MTAYLHVPEIDGPTFLIIGGVCAPSSRIWAPLGGMLVVAVAAWRLAGATYRADVETICDAEKRSGLALRLDMPALGEWVRAHLVTSEGNELYSSLGDVPMAERAARVRSTALALGLPACPMARSYEELVADGESRADLQRLCSYVTFPGIERLDDPGRLDVIEAWIERESTNARTKALAEPLRRAETPVARARLLRASAGAIDVYACDLAKAIESPPPDAGEVDGGSE